MKLLFKLLIFSWVTGFSVQINAANRYWVAATAGNWNNTANWSATSGGPGGVSVPGPSDAVTFNNGSLNNCTINATVTVASLNVMAAYTGIIAQGGNTITVSGALTFAGGTFTGGSANISISGTATFSGGSFNCGSGNITASGAATFSGGIFTGGTGNITITGIFTLSGCAFTSTSNKLEFNNNAVFTSATFLHNNGTVRFNGTGTSTPTMSGASTPGFYTLEYAGLGKTYNITSTGNVSVANALNITGTLFCTLNTGVFDVAGDINITNTATGGGGTAMINLNGSGVQNFNGASSAGAGVLPQLTINNPTGAINMSGFPGVANSFTYTAGTINAGASTFCFVRNSLAAYTVNCSATLNNIYITAASSALTLTITGILAASGDLSIAGGANVILNTGTINAGGDIAITNTATGGGGTATILINGTGAQSFTSSVIAGQGRMPLITIQKTSGTLTLGGIISESRAWTYTSGTVDATTNASTVVFGGNNLNITSNGMSFNDIVVTANTSTLTNNLTVIGDLTINGTGILAPVANTINIAGNWTNRATAGFTEATSTVNFNGGSLQTMTCTGGDNFANLIINNSSAGVQLINAASVSTSLTMSAGNIDLNGNNLTLGTSATIPGTLTYTSGNIINTGSFIRWLKTSTLIPAGSAAGLFPMGTASDKRAFLLSAPATAPTTGGKVSVTYTNATSNSAVTFNDGIPVVLVRKDLKWAVTTTSLAGGNYNLQIQGTGYGTIGNVADLRLTLVNGVIGTAGTNGGTTTNPQVNRTGLTLANLSNTFYLASVSSTNSPLPVTLISFSARFINEEVKLDWETSVEMNNDYFTIQRSADGITWQEITMVKGRGNTTTDTYYGAIDKYPLPGNSFYRLQQTDIDGKKSYSSVRKISINASSIINVYPNPATNYITIKSYSPDKLIVSLFNSSGQKMNVLVSSESNNTIVNVSSLASGSYYLQLKQANLIETKRIVILK